MKQALPSDVLRRVTSCEARKSNQRSEDRIEKLMKRNSVVSIFFAAGILITPTLLSAQNAPVASQQPAPAPQLKKIGAPTSDRPKMEPALI
jgi:hypothetical protein